MAMKNYTVSLDGLLGHENIIFKLICSVSERTKNRSSSYSLTESSENADIHINDIKNKTDESKTDLNHVNVWVSNTSDNTDDVIARPLIATRVLHTLDNLVVNITPSNNNKITEKLETNTKANDYNITEEEASELAIVHDDILENPSNKEEIPQTSNIELTLVKNIASQQHNKTGSSHVLVVDDSQSVRKQLELELDLFNVTADFADSAEAAFKLLESNTYQLALLDVVLPDKDGYQICKNIKAKNNKTVAIMLTGKATQADKIKGSLAGCDDYLVKPVGRMTFQNAVKNFISLKDTNTAIEA